MDQTFIDSYSCYDSYKDSGVDWLGEIPEEWNLTPAFKFINENKLKNKGLTVDTVLSLSYGNILIKPKEKLTGLVPESFETYQIVEPNDIIIRCMDLQNDKTSLRIGLVKDKGIITSAYLALKVANSYLPEYLYYYLHSLDTSKAIYKMGTGLRQNLSFGDFKRFQVPNIPLKVQQSIVDFVKTKSAQIDQAITLKQQQIAKLEEYKQIVIQNAVTKGLNPDAPMKDSGVDWIGNIPTHWEIKKLMFVTENFNKKVLSSESGLPYIGMESIESKTGQLSDENSEAEGLASYFKKGQILFGKLRPYLAKVYLTDFEGLCSTEFMVMSVRSDILDVFLKYQLLSNRFIAQINSSTYGSKMPRASAEYVKRQSITLPPIEEQKFIVDHIDSITNKINQTLLSYKSQIDRLKEYKTILINQAVTGKIKVS